MQRDKNRQLTGYLKSNAYGLVVKSDQKAEVTEK